MTVGRASDTDVLGIRAYAPAWPLGDAETSVGRDETSPWPALFCLLIGLLLGALAATLLTGTLQLAAFLLGAVISLVAAAASRHAALALLGALLVGHVTFTNEFAKNAVSVGGVPLYVTDVVLAVVMSATILGGRWRRPEATPLLLGVGLLAGVGAVLTLGAMLSGRELLLVLRQSALFYYA
ncbi:MAG: hypothetical protein ACRDM0_16025, partial [Thermoleophilaceae bacterium]